MKKNSIIIAVTLQFVWSVCALAGQQVESIPLGIEKVENDQSTHHIAAVAKYRYHPKSSVYIVQGKVRYKNIEGDAYLEMWNVMPDGSRYFSRTLAEVGPMRKISGSSDWRDFELPFNLMDHKPEYVDLEINIVMPGKGSIELASLTVSDAGTVTAGSVGSAALLGAILGGAVGLYGGLLGVVAGLLVPHGKGRQVVAGLFLFGFILGVVLLVLGIIAFTVRLPFGVFFPLAFVGVDLMILLPILYYTAVRKGYAQAELRKMQALDV